MAEALRLPDSYFITTDIRPLGETDGFAFCRSLPEHCGVVAIPNVVFYDRREHGALFADAGRLTATDVPA